MGVRAAECFVVCGLPASPVTVDGVAGFVGAGESYRPEVLSSYPPRARPPRGAGTNRGETDEPSTTGDDQGSRPPWPPHLALCAMPLGVDVHVASDPPRDALAPTSYPIVLTDGDGAPVYCACLAFLAPVPSRTRAAVPALRSACARMCVVLVSRAPIIDVLRHALNAVVGRCAFGTQPWSDAPPVGAIGAALVDGLNVASSFYLGTNARRLIDRPIDSRGARLGSAPTRHRDGHPRGVRPRGVRPAPTTLFSVCGETFALPPVDDDDAWIDWRRDPHVNTDTERRSELDDSDYHDDSYDDDSDDSDSDRLHETSPTDSSYPRGATPNDARVPSSVTNANANVHPTSAFLAWRRDNGFPSFDDAACSFEPLLRCLDERNAVKAVCAVALERRVLLRASSNSLLVAVSGGILRALRPLRYRGVFVPCLPSSLADYADAPTPYLMGFRSVRGTSAGSSVINGSSNNVLDDALAAERLDGVVVVDLDANVVTDLANRFRGEGGDEGVTLGSRSSRAKSKSHSAHSRSRSRGKSRERRTNNDSDDRSAENVSPGESSWPGESGDELARRLRRLRSPDLCEMDASSAEYVGGGAQYVGGGAQYDVGDAQYDVGGAQYDVGGAQYVGDVGEREFRAALAAANGSLSDYRAASAGALDSGFSPGGLRNPGGPQRRRRRHRKRGDWSTAHDACAQLCFAALWRDVVRGYRSYLLDVGQMSDTDGGGACFDVDGFLAEKYPDGTGVDGGNAPKNGSAGPRLDPNRPRVPRAFAAAFVSTASFARHCEVQIADAVSAAERDRRRFGAVSGSNPRGDSFSGTLPDVASREGAKQSGQNAPRGAKLVDPMLAEDHDDRSSGGSHDGSGVEGNTRAVTGRLVTGKIVRRPRVFDPSSFEGAYDRSSYVGTSGRGFDSARGRTRVATRGVTFRSVQLSRGGWDDDELLDEDGVPSGGDLPVHVGNGTDRLANDDDDVPSSFGGFTAVGHGAGSPSPHALTLRRSVNHASVESSSHRQTQPPNPPRAGLPAMEPVCVTSNGDSRAGERDPWRSAVPGSIPGGGGETRDSRDEGPPGGESDLNVSSSGLSFLGFGDGANNGTNGTRVPVQRASSVTHGLSTIRPGGPAGVRGNPSGGQSGTSTESSDRAGTAGHRPRHGRSASSTSFFAPAPSSPPRDRRAGLIPGSSNSESDGEGSTAPGKTNSGKNLSLSYLASSMSPPRMFGSPSKQRSFRERRRQSEDMTTRHPPNATPADPNSNADGRKGQVKDKSSEKMKSSYGASIFGLTFRSRRKSEAARFKAQRGESDHGANNFGPTAAGAAAARAAGSGGDLSQWIAMMSSETPAPSAQNSRKDLDVTAGETAGETASETAAAIRTSPADALDVPGGDGNVELAENVADLAEKKTHEKTVHQKPTSSELAPAPETAEKRSETVRNGHTETASSFVAAKTRELWSLASAGADIRARAAAAAAAVRALRPVCSTRSTNMFDVRRSTLSAAAAELVAVDLDGVLAAMEGAHGDDGTLLGLSGTLGPGDSLAGVHQLDHSPVPGLLSYYSGQSLRLIEETSGEGASLSPSEPPGFDSRSGQNHGLQSTFIDETDGAENEAERSMRAADDEAKRSARAAARRRSEKARLDAALELTRWPGYRAALDAVAVAAIASGDVAKVAAVLRVVRGNDGRVALPGGARVWSDPNVWIGLYDFYESCAEFGNEFEDDSYDDSYDDDVGGPSLANPPGIEPATGRALRAANDRSCTPAALAGRMASVGLPPHAVAALLASACAKRSKKRSKKRSTKGGTNESRRTPLEKGADDVGKGRVGKSGATKTLGKTLEDADAAAGLPRRVAPIPASSADRVGRSVGRVWEVSSSLPTRGIEPLTSSTPSDAPTDAINPRGKTGAGIGVSHDAWIERMRRASRWVGTRGESAPHQSAPHQSAPHPRGSQSHPGGRGSDAENEAPWWARAEATAGLGGASPFSDVFSMSEFNGASKKKRTFTVRLNSRVVTVENGRIEEDEDEGDGDTPRRDGAILVDEGLEEYLSGLDLDGEEDFEFHDPRDEDEFLRFDRFRPLRRRGDWCDLPADVLAASPWSDRRERSARTSGGSDFVQPSNSISRRNSIRLDGPDSRWGADTSSHHAITAVAVGAGGIAAVGSCHGAFAAWNPRTGVVVRARPGGWGEAVSVAGAIGTNRHYNPTVGLTALGFTAGSSSGLGGGDGGNRSGDLAVGGTRGGGVAAWDVRTGACVCASPGSHAGAVTIVQSATSASTSASTSSSTSQVSSTDVGSGGELSNGSNADNNSSFGAVFGHPALALTASNAPADGRVRLWDVRAGPRETAAALGGHRGGVHAVSCESPKFVFTGDGDGVVRAWDWRRAGGGPIASANAHDGVVTAVTPLRFDRADVAASAGVDGVVRVLSLDGGKGGGVALVGHLAPVTGLVRLGGFVGEGGSDLPDPSSKATSHRPVAGHGRRLSSIADLTRGPGGHPGDVAFDRRLGSSLGGSGGMTDSYYSGNVSGQFAGLASASADGAVRLWCPDGGGGAGWRCAAVAHAHASRVVAMARCTSGTNSGSSGSSSGGGVSSSGRLFRGTNLLTAGDDASFARWPDAEPFLRRARNSRSGVRPVQSSVRYRRVGGSNPRGGGAAWTPERMHHRCYVQSPRVVCAIDASGSGALVVGTRDGVVTCASLE